MNPRTNAQPHQESPGGNTSQLLRYAQELQQLHEIERTEREQLVSAQAALAQAHVQQLAIAADLRRALDSQQQQQRDFYEAYVATLRVMAAAVEARAGYPGRSTERVHHVALAVARELKLDQETLQRVELGSILRDFGKIAIPERILAKPGPLEPDEWSLLKRHTTLGADLIRGLPLLSAAADILATHHERWDGTGYPLGLTGEAIPLEGRIVALADAFGSMTAARPFRPARPVAEAVVALRHNSGRHFDPALVDVFLTAWQKGRIEIETDTPAISNRWDKE